MTTTDPRLHQYLSQLPEPELPESLWPRIDKARLRRTRRHRWVMGVAASALAGIALIPLSSLNLSDPTPAPGNRQAVETAAPAERDHDAVRSLDRELQAAYERGASDAEIESLWSARRSLLAGRPSNHDASPVYPIHI